MRVLPFVGEGFYFLLLYIYLLTLRLSLGGRSTSSSLPSPLRSLSSLAWRCFTLLADAGLFLFWLICYVSRLIR